METLFYVTLAGSLVGSLFGSAIAYALRKVFGGG